MRRLFSIGLLLLFLAFPLVAGAQGREGNWDPQEAFRQAQLFASNGQLHKGLALFLKIREKSPGFRPMAVQRNICRLYERTGDIPQALKEYENFIQRYPWARDRVQILMRMAAMAEVALHDLDRAWKYLDMVPENKVPPGDMAPYLFNKGYLLEKMGKREEALEYYRRLVEEYPDTVGGFWARERIKELEGEAQGTPQIILPREGKE